MYLKHGFDYATPEERCKTGKQMRSSRCSGFRLLLLALGAAGSALPQTQAKKAAAKAAAAPQARLFVAINEGAAGNADASETLFRYQELTQT